MLRLTGGGWRGRKLPPLLNRAGVKVRPSTGRVREALFSSLGAMDGWRCLDLFAGSGALGLEAASRGAAEVWFVERHRQSAERIRKTAAALIPATSDGGEDGEGGEVRVITKCAYKFLASTKTVGFDLIFIDPPFNSMVDDEDWRRLLSAAYPHLSVGGIVYLESPRRLTAFAPWAEKVSRRAGGVHWHLWRAQR